MVEDSESFSYHFRHLGGLNWEISVYSLAAMPEQRGGGRSMPTFVIHGNLTDQGIRTIKEGPARRAAVKEKVKSMGGEVTALYRTTGQFDALMILEAPDGETVAKIALWIGMQGNMRTTISRAFTEDENAAIIAGLD